MFISFLSDDYEEFFMLRSLRHKVTAIRNVPF